MEHLEKNNETYFSHFKFATKIGLTLLLRGGIFILHGLFPICGIPKRLNLGNTYSYLKECNEYAERRKKRM